MSARKAGYLSSGVPEIDPLLPGGGLAYGALHEFAGGGAGTLMVRLQRSLRAPVQVSASTVPNTSLGAPCSL